jgi:hypothetical protein
VNAQDRTRVGSRLPLGNVADAACTVVECRHVRIVPTHFPPVSESTACTDRYEERAEPSARISPACQRARFGSSRRPKKRSASTLGSHAS